MNILEAASKLCDEGKLEEAYRLASTASQSIPEEPRAAYIIAHCHLKAGRAETAYYIYRYIQKFPAYNSPMVWNQIGMCLDDMGHLEEAEHWYLKALARGPTTVTHSSLAAIYTKKGDPQKAVDHADKALALDPSCMEAKWNGALALLKLRQWEKGWEWYDTLIGSKVRPPPPEIGDKDLPIWSGEPGTVLIHGEQGLGDEIMFCSMLEEASKLAKIVLAVDPRLVKLLQRSLPNVIVTSRRGKEIVLPEAVEFTHRLALGSLGRLLRNADADFPGRPYIAADPRRSLMYRALLDSLGPGKKIGILWKGGVGGLDERERSLALHDLEPLLSADVTWVSLNHLPGTRQECERFYETNGVKVHHFDFAHGFDYDDTAALIDAVDVVISVTGTAAHVASAMGKETHVLVPKMCQWRYGASGDSIPWYSSMKLWRQTDHWPLKELRESVLG